MRVVALVGEPWLAVLAVVALIGAGVWLALVRTRLTIVLEAGAGSGKVLGRGLVRITLARWSWQKGFALTADEAKMRLLQVIRRWTADRTTDQPPPPNHTPGSRQPSPAGRLQLLQTVWSEITAVMTHGGFHLAEIGAVVSTGDAAETALVCGLINGILGAAVAMLQSSPVRARWVRAYCQPMWADSLVWRLELRCILRPTLSQAIRAAWRVYRLSRSQRGRAPGTKDAPERGV